MWLLIAIHLNLTVVPVAVEHGEILETFSSEQACIESHTKFFDGLKEKEIKLPANFNLGCIPFNRKII